jgi:hypothetical protein
MAETKADLGGERILVHCPACGRDYRIAASHAGQHGKCACGHVLIVPQPEAPPGTIKCPACGRWTRPEGWCEWCSAPLETHEPVHLPDVHQDVDAAPVDADSPLAAVAGAPLQFAAAGALIVGGALLWPDFLVRTLDFRAEIAQVLLIFVALFTGAVFRSNWQRGSGFGPVGLATCFIILAAGGFLMGNQWFDGSPEDIVVPRVTGAGYHSGRRSGHYYVDMDLGRSDLPAHLNLHVWQEDASLAQSGPVELVLRRGAFGLPWWQEIRRHEGPAPSAVPGTKP